MAKSRLLGFGRQSRSTDLNIINPNVARSSKRRAKTSFWITALSVTALAALIISADAHPVLAIALGAGIGVVVGVVVYLAVWSWPVVRILWHWLPELLISSGVLVGVSALGQATSGPIAIGALICVAGTLFAPSKVRRYVLAIAWCFISRHRIRVAFASFLAGNRQGTVPLILWAKPTPVGERVWVWLRPGHSVEDLEGRGDKLAVCCYAASVAVASASVKYASLVRFDIKRRSTFDTDVSSPLVGEITEPAPVRDTSVTVTDDVSALDLTDVTEDSVATPVKEPVQRPRKEPKKPVAVPAIEDENDPAYWA